MSLPEVLLWQHLRGAALGPKFRRQHPIGPYVVDFYCREAALVIEIDGEAHDQAERPALDAVRDAFLNQNGYVVLRIPAAEIFRNAEGVIAMIAMKARASNPLHRPADGPPPRAGEEF